MQIDRYFDVIYTALCVVLLVSLAAAVVFGVALARRGGSSADADHGRGTAFAAVGTALALSGGLLADALLKATPWFQQVRFGFYFVGFALIVVGVGAIIRGALADRGGFVTRLPLILLGLFAATFLVAILFLAIPQTFVLNQYGEQIQLPVYWLPLLVSTAAEAIALVAVAARSAGVGRKRAVLAALFSGLLFLGLLRESEILPDLGDPLVNLLVSFVPFVAAAICLAAGSWPQRGRGQRS